MYTGPINWWVQSVMPVVFDNSLSYYEVLSKLTSYITGVMNDVNEIEKIIGTIENIGDIEEFVKFLEDVQKEIGNLQNLSTENKEDIVSALNEVAQKANLAYVKPSEGIPESDLSEDVRRKLASEGGSGVSNYNDLSNKPSINGIELIGNKTGNSLNLGSYSKPSGGIPMSDLSTEVQDAIAHGGGSSGTTNYGDLNNKPAINGVVLKSGNNSLESLGIGTYNKPNGGIPENDLSEDVRDKLNTSGGIADGQNSFVADRKYEKGELVYINGKLYRVENTVLPGTTMVVGNNIIETTISEEIERVNGDLSEIQSRISTMSGFDSFNINADVSGNNGDAWYRVFTDVSMIGGEEYLFICTPVENPSGYRVRISTHDGVVVTTKSVSNSSDYINQYRFTLEPTNTGIYIVDFSPGASSGSFYNRDVKYNIRLEYTQSQGITAIQTMLASLQGVPDDIDAIEHSLEEYSGKIDTNTTNIEKINDGIVEIEKNASSLSSYIEIYLPNTVIPNSNSVKTYLINMPGNGKAKFLKIINNGSSGYFGYSFIENDTVVFGPGTREEECTEYIGAGKTVEINIPDDVDADTFKIRNRNARDNVNISIYSNYIEENKQMLNSLLYNSNSFPSDDIRNHFTVYSEDKVYYFDNIVDFKTKLTELQPTTVATGAYALIIPLIGVKRITYPLVKPTANYGSIIFNSNDEVIWKYRETTLPTGSLKTIDVPDYASYMLLVISTSLASMTWSVTLETDTIGEIRENDKDQNKINDITNELLNGCITIPYSGIGGEGLNGGTVSYANKSITIEENSSGYNSYIRVSHKIPDYLAGKNICAIASINSPNYQIDKTDVFFSNPSGVNFATEKNIVKIGDNYIAILNITLPDSLSSTYGFIMQVKKNYYKSVETVITINDVYILSRDFTKNMTDNLSGEIIIEVGTGKEYTSLRTALEKAAKIANKYTHVTVRYYGDGVEYDLLNDITSDDLTEESSFRGLVVPAYTKLVGMGSREQNKVSLAIPAGTATAVAFRISTVNLDENGELENMWFYGKGCRYACHDDTQTRNPKWKLKTIKNCKFTSDFTNQHRAYGAGYRSGVNWKFINCIFENINGEATQYGNAAFSAHNNNAMSIPASIEFVNCQFTGGHGVTLQCLNNTSGQSYSNAITSVSFYGCKATAEYWTKAVLITLPGESESEVMEVNVTGFGNNFDNTTNLGVYYSNAFHTSDYLDQLSLWGMITEGD